MADESKFDLFTIFEWLVCHQCEDISLGTKLFEAVFHIYHFT